MYILKAIGVTLVGSIVLVKLVAPQANTTPAHASTAPEKPPLHLVSFSCHNESGFEIIDGEVENKSSEKFDALMAVGYLFAGDNTFITSSTSVVEYNPLMPGQTSPFKIMTTFNPMMSKCNVGFKTIFGGEIAMTR